MQILVVTIGSAGDVHPFIALSAELQRRGHHVTLATSDYFEQDIRKAGLDFFPLFSAEAFSDILEHPDLWHPTRGFKLLYQNIFIPLAPVVYRLIAERYRPGELGVVASTLGFGARIAQEKLRVPVVTVHLQPTCLRSAYDTPVYPGIRMGPGLPRWAKRALFFFMDRAIDRLMGPGLNDYRRTLDLPPVARIFDRWVHSPDSVLGLFPAWYAPPQPDWPPNTFLSDFPLFDGAAQQPLPESVRRFLEEGQPPVIFTAGSAMRQGKWFFKAAAEACERLKCRGLLINRFREQVPADLPSTLCYAEYAPFSAVFPRGRVVVHHGGIGTTAQVFAAGVPQVIVPLSFDQPDQAMRVERLGVGRQIAQARFEGAALAEVLRDVMNDEGLVARAREVAGQVDRRGTVAVSCDIIEQSFRRSALAAVTPGRPNMSN